MGIKLKDIITEAVAKKRIQEIIDKVYPWIVKDLGGKHLRVEIHNNIYKRLDAVGVEILMGENNPTAEFDWDLKRIYIYSSAIKNEEEVIKALLHEHTHSLQNRERFRKMYDDGKTYRNHPYEIAARRSENKSKKFLKYLDKS